MADWAAKRFWTETSVAEVENGFAVHLDGRPVRTPAKSPLIVPTVELAQELCAEWDAQDGAIDPEGMPYTRGANAAIDKVRTQHSEVADMLAAYGDSDLVCYRAHSPRELVALQAESWDPVLEWLEARFDARLEARAGVMHVPQDEASLSILTNQVHQFDAFELSAFHDMVALSGSLALAFAATEGWKDAKTLWDLSRVDEIYQISQWGEDEEAMANAAKREESFLRAVRFYQLVQK